MSRPADFMSPATGASTSSLYMVHRRLTAEIAALTRKKGRYFKPETRDLWNNRQVTMQYFGSGRDDYEDVDLDEFIKHVKSH